MQPRIKRLLLTVLLLLVAIFGIATWGTIRVIAWARDLPNRIVIDGDAIGDAWGAAATEYYHQALTNGDVTIQRQVLRDFLTAVESDKAISEWIRDEYLSDISDLVSYSDADVAADANSLLMLFENPNAGSQAENGR
jgi:hypothetical protein